MLLIGGFALAGALSKHAIAKRAATAVIARVGTRPAAVLLANMLVGTFASMWISNVAAPVLCYSVAQPILRNLERDHPFAKALVLGAPPIPPPAPLPPPPWIAQLAAGNACAVYPGPLTL